MPLNLLTVNFSTVPTYDWGSYNEYVLSEIQRSANRVSPPFWHSCDSLEQKAQYSDKNLREADKDSAVW